jgi:cytochrome c peroxidase
MKSSRGRPITADRASTEHRSARSRSRAVQLFVGIGALAALTLTDASMGLAQTQTPDAAAVLVSAREIFKPLPADMATPQRPVTPQLVDLGRDLYFDPRLSGDGTVSCARCHAPSLYGSDGLPKSRGVFDKINPRHAPTVLNAALQFRQHWSGNRRDVEDQATQAFLGPASFGNPSYDVVIARINAVPGYPPLFTKAFPEEKNPVTPANIGRAIGAYERTLVSPAPFDDFLKGNTAALTPVQVAGLQTFIETGCASCHNGVDVGGNLFRKFGLVEDYWKETGSKEMDRGRFDLTHNPDDLYVFKVPALRNIAMIPPYFHDGSVATLAGAVRVMAKVQLGKQLSDAQTDAIVGFLGSLTGSLPRDFVTAPPLPTAPYPPAHDAAKH